MQDANSNDTLGINMQLDASKFQVTRTGLVFKAAVSLDEWEQLGSQLSGLYRGSQWMIGDWLIYGEDNFLKVHTERYDAAVAATKLDRQTLANYAYTSRSIPASSREEAVPHCHHLAVAKIKDPDERMKWLKTAVDYANKGTPINRRRFRRSIECGRVITVEEMQVDQNDRGRDNHHPWLTGLSSWWLTVTQNGWHSKASRAQVEAVIRDFEQVSKIIDDLRELRDSLPAD